MNRSGEIAARVDAVQRGRSAMDDLTRQLRSQVCLQNAGIAAMVQPRSIESATTDSVTFYTDLRDTSENAPVPPPGTPTGPERRRIALVNGTIVQERWTLTPVGGRVQPRRERDLDPPAAPERRRSTSAPARRAADTPLFRYYAYDFALAVPQPKRELVPNPTLTAAQLQSVARIEITYRAHPTRRRNDGRASIVFDERRGGPHGRSQLRPDRACEPMPLTPSPIHLRGERGFSMFLVVVAMLVTAMFVAAGFAAANGDLRLSVESKERKAAYAAAEAGLGFYLKELRENPDVLDAVRRRLGPERRGREPDQPAVERRRRATIRAAGARSRACPPSTRSSCSTAPATTSAGPSRRRSSTSRTAPSRFASPAAPPRTAGPSAAS